MTRAESRRLRLQCLALMLLFPGGFVGFVAFRLTAGFWPWQPAWGEPFEDDLPRAKAERRA